LVVDFTDVDLLVVLAFGLLDDELAFAVTAVVDMDVEEALLATLAVAAAAPATTAAVCFLEEDLAGLNQAATCLVLASLGESA
jgi:hypothetical protein